MGSRRGIGRGRKHAAPEESELRLDLSWLRKGYRKTGHDAFSRKKNP